MRLRDEMTNGVSARELDAARLMLCRWTGGVETARGLRLCGEMTNGVGARELSAADAVSVDWRRGLRADCACAGK